MYNVGHPLTLDVLLIIFDLFHRLLCLYCAYCSPTGSWNFMKKIKQNIANEGTPHSVDNLSRILNHIQSQMHPKMTFEQIIDHSPSHCSLQAVTVKGFGGGPDKKDVYDYFKEFSPVSMELVDGNTINVVWALPASAAKAMLSLSRPLLEREMEMEVNEVKAAAVGDGDDGEDDDDDEHDDDDEDSRRNRESKKGKENLINKAELVRRVSSLLVRRFHWVLFVK